MVRYGAFVPAGSSNLSGTIGIALRDPPAADAGEAEEGEADEAAADAPPPVVPGASVLPDAPRAPPHATTTGRTIAATAWRRAVARVLEFTQRFTRSRAPTFLAHVQGSARAGEGTAQSTTPCPRR